jgi:cytochrome c
LDNDLRGPRGHDEINQARSAGNYGWPHFVANNKAYRDYDFATQLSGPAFDPNAPINESPNNTGPRELPPARPAWIWYSYAYPSAEFPETDQPGNFFRCGMAGPVYRFNPTAAANNGLPSYYDKTLFIYDWARGFVKEIKLDEDGRILKINQFLPTFSFLRPIDMKLGPDGAIYMIEWGTDFGGGAGAKVIRIDYSGGNQLAVLQSAESLNGPFADHPTILFDEDARTFTAPLVGQERFFRLRSTTAHVIGDVARVGSGLRIAVE